MKTSIYSDPFALIGGVNMNFHKKYRLLLLALTITICIAQATSYAHAEIYLPTAGDLAPYRINGDREIRDIHLETSFCSVPASKTRLCVEEENICHEVFAYLKEKLHAVTEEQNFRLYGCGADERHVPRQERENALFIEYQLHATEKTMFKQSIPFNIYVLRSFHKRWKDGEGFSSREMYPPFPIPETNDWNTFRQDIQERIYQDIERAVKWLTWSETIKKMHWPKESLAEESVRVRAENVLNHAKSTPENIMKLYHTYRKIVQEGLALRPNYLWQYEQFLQEKGFFKKSMTRTDFTDEFVRDTIEKYKDAPEKLLSIYTHLKFLHDVNEQTSPRYFQFYKKYYEEPDDRYLKPYEKILNDKGLL